MVLRWTFHDPSMLETYTFQINPQEGGSPSYEKTISYENTSAPDGAVIMFEGRNPPQKMEFSGVVRNEAEYNAFVTWWEKRHQVQITDDLGREFMIEIESFSPTRVRSAMHPWKHTYNVRATIVSGWSG